MRLKKVPKGTKIISFRNNSKKDVVLFLNRGPFLLVRAESFHIIEAPSFVVGRPMKEFPEMQLYAGFKIEVLFQ